MWFLWQLVGVCLQQWAGGCLGCGYPSIEVKKTELERPPDKTHWRCPVPHPWSAPTIHIARTHCLRSSPKGTCKLPGPGQYHFWSWSDKPCLWSGRWWAWGWLSGRGARQDLIANLHAGDQTQPLGGGTSPTSLPLEEVFYTSQPPQFPLIHHHGGYGHINVILRKLFFPCIISPTTCFAVCLLCGILVIIPT